MSVYLLERGEDSRMIEALFPAAVRGVSTEFLVAARDGDEILGCASMGYEQDTLILQYLFVPEEYRRKGVATSLISEITERLYAVTDSFLEAYFDEGGGQGELAAFFDSLKSFTLHEYPGYCVARWSGVPEGMPTDPKGISAYI